MSLSVKGRVIQVLDEQRGTSKSGNEWKKQEFVVETEEQFPKKVCFTLFNDKISQAQNLSIGDEVEVSFSVESREFNGRWYHNINAWKVEKASSEADVPPPPDFGSDDVPPEAGPDDLPF